MEKLDHIEVSPEERIKDIDARIVDLVVERKDVSAVIGKIKQESGATIYNHARELEVFEKFKDKVGLDLSLEIILPIVRECRSLQYGKIDVYIPEDVDRQEVLTSCREDIDGIDAELAELVSENLSIELPDYSVNFERSQNFAELAEKHGISEELSTRLANSLVSYRQMV